MNPADFLFRSSRKILLALALAAGAISALCAEPTKVACVGDSITFGYLIPQRENFHYPKILGELLGKDFEVRNFGNPGKTCGDYPSQKGRKRWYGDNIEHKAASEWQADIYICNLWINDTGAWWNPKLFSEGYEHLIKDWRGNRKNVPVFIWTQLAPDFRGPDGKKTFPGNIFKPEFAFPGQDNGSAKNRPTAQKLLKKLAVQEKLHELDAYSPLCAHPEMMLPDGLHPNAKGARRIAEFTFAKLATAKIPGVKIKNLQPKLVPAKDKTSIVLKNPHDTAILLDGASLHGKNGASFVFGNATVIAPGAEISVKLGGEKDQNDPAFPLVSSKIKSANDVKFKFAPRK